MGIMWSLCNTYLMLKDKIDDKVLTPKYNQIIEMYGKIKEVEKNNPYLHPPKGDEIEEKEPDHDITGKPKVKSDKNGLLRSQ